MLAIIPARGGSKGLPGKNIKLLNNKPLIAYTIEQALLCKEITDVFVTTDCAEIAEVARNYGAWVPELRPSHLAEDNSTTLDVLEYVLNYLKINFDKSYESFIVLQPTSPLRNVEHIREAYAMYKNQNADSIISFTENSHSIFWNKFVNEEGRISRIFEETVSSNRQESKKAYYPNGSIYLINSNFFLKNRTLYSDNTYAYIMKKEVSFDIDDLFDFNIVQFLIQNDEGL